MISKKTKYALKALEILGADYPHKKPYLIADLAEKGRIPKKFLELILLEMKNNEILQSKKGKGGGYFLAKAPSEISLGNVMRLLEGPLAPLPCVSQTAYKRCDECIDEHTCSIRMLMKEVRDATAAIFDGTTLQDMLDKAGHSEQITAYSI
jgi:Rrf2 family protein